MAIPKSILFGLEQTRGDGAAQLPLGDTDWLLTDWELPWDSGWSRAPPELSSAGLIRLKAKAEAASPSCHPLPCAPLPGSCHSWVAVGRPGLQQQPSCSASAIEREKKNQPKSRFGASLVAPVLCHGDFFTNQSPESESEPVTAVENSVVPICWDGDAMSQHRKLRAFVCLTLVLLLQLSISRGWGGGFIPLAAAALSWPQSYCWGSTA